MTILVTGGAGYIGSHTVLCLLQAGQNVVVLDNLSNASAESLRRVAALAGKAAPLVEADINDRAALDTLFRDYPVSGVLHFAGLKAVGESVQQPLRYYRNNVSGTLTLCQAMAAAGVFRLVFSSSATIYGDGHSMPLHEALPTGEPTNPYARSKLMVEQLLGDLARADPRWSMASFGDSGVIGLAMANSGKNKMLGAHGLCGTAIYDIHNLDAAVRLTRDH